MQMTELLPKIGDNDLKIIRRDNFLLFMLVYVIFIGLFVRYAMPWLNIVMAENGVLPNARMPIALADLYPMLVAYFCLFVMVLLPGSVYGFMLLDEKDDNTLSAMLVTPLPLQQYLGYRLAVVTALAFVIVLFMLYAVAQALLPLWKLIFLAAGAALAAPIAALCFGVFAENKVQGFAYSKFGGIAGWTVLIGWFVPEPWQWLIGFFPPFWVSKAYWMALEGRPAWWIALIAGFVLQAALIALLMRRFQVNAYR